MGLFNKTSNKSMGVVNSPIHKARAAFQAGDEYLEIAICLEKITGVFGFSSVVNNKDDIGSLLTKVANEGWELINTNHTFQVNHLATSGFESARLSQVKGQTMGFYIFKRKAVQ